VKSSPYSPSGPDRDKSKYIAKPTTTGGKAIKDEENIIITFRPVNLPIANAVPIGIAKKAAIKVADREIRKDSATIFHKVASPEEIK